MRVCGCWGCVDHHGVSVVGRASFGLGMSIGEHTVGFTFNTWLPCWVVVVGVPAFGAQLGWVVGVWWVVGELYSGCEHLYFLFCGFV